MNVVDSSAWLSFFSGDENSGLFAQPILAIEELLIPSIILTEVFKSILRQKNEESAFAAIAHIQQGNVIPLNGELAINAACFGIDFKLPLADSIIYATARKYKAVVWTQDADFRGLDGVKFYPKARTT